MSRQKKTVLLLRELLSVLRTLTRNSSDKYSSTYKHTYGYCYIASLYRNKNVCDKNTTGDLQFLAETYLCLLKSVRDGKILYHQYKGAGELSVEEIANRVGFQLPGVPKHLKTGTDG